MRHSQIARAAGMAAAHIYQTLAAEDGRVTAASLDRAIDAQFGREDQLYQYARARKFPSAEVLWRKAHEFDEIPVTRDFHAIAEAERAGFIAFRAVAEALEPFHEPDPDPAHGEEAETPAQEAGAAGSGEMAEGEGAQGSPGPASLDPNPGDADPSGVPDDDALNEAQRRAGELDNGDHHADQEDGVDRSASAPSDRGEEGGANDADLLNQDHHADQSDGVDHSGEPANKKSTKGRSSRT